MPIDDAGPKDARLSRRLLLVHALSGAAGTGLVVASGGRARAQSSGVTDTDPGDPAGNGRGGTGTGATDQDPSDPPGGGRGGGRQGATDQDPTDPPGGGRGGGGVTDQDPYDPAGRGRGNRRRAIDADPTD